ncbi:hypothetical protein ACTVZO_35790 [Streptomyces sp. IBSNAI002]
MSTLTVDKTTPPAPDGTPRRRPRTRRAARAPAAGSSPRKPRSTASSS